jgi:hypothetical protein
MALADLRDRTRRYSFFVTLAATIWFASVCLPPIGAHYSTVRFGEWRGIYNSAWVGGVFAVLGSLFLALPGFYLVKNALARDRATGVGAILAATPISRFTYLASKMLSTIFMLSCWLFIFITSASPSLATSATILLSVQNAFTIRRHAAANSGEVFAAHRHAQPCCTFPVVFEVDASGKVYSPTKITAFRADSDIAAITAALQLHSAQIGLL